MSATIELARNVGELRAQVGRLKKALLNLRNGNEGPMGDGPPCWCPPGGYVLVHGHCDTCRECRAALG